MSSRFSRFLVIIAAVQILGGHWALIQSVAWVRMISEFAQRDTLAVAVAKTFSGEHPCKLCRAVSKGVQQEKQQDEVVVVAKLEAILASAFALPPPRQTTIVYPSLECDAQSLGLSPATPPPRFA